MKKLIICMIVLFVAAITWSGDGLPATVHVDGDKVITNEPIIIEAKAQQFLDSVLPVTDYGTAGARVIIPEWGYTARVNRDDGRHYVNYGTDACTMSSPEWNHWSIGTAIGDHVDEGLYNLVPSAVGDEMLLVYPDRTEHYILTDVIIGYAAHEYGEDSDFYDLEGVLIRDYQPDGILMVTCRDGDEKYKETARTFGVWAKK